MCRHRADHGDDFRGLDGAEIFSNFINFAGLPEALAGWIAGLGLNAYVVMVGSVLIYLVFG